MLELRMSCVNSDGITIVSGDPDELYQLRFMKNMLTQLDHEGSHIDLIDWRNSNVYSQEGVYKFLMSEFTRLGMNWED